MCVSANSLDYLGLARACIPGRFDYSIRRMKGRSVTPLFLCMMAIQFVFAPVLLADQDPSMILTPGSLSNSQFQFTLNAESGITYFIQASSNLSDWVCVGTNTDPGTNRVITITNLPDGQGFYRAAKRPFGFALLAVQNITLAGGTLVDSFDSYLGPYSSANRAAGGNIGTDSTATNFAVSLSGAHVCGKVFIGPGGIINLSGGSSIGDLDWNATYTGIESGWINDTMNLFFPSNSPPPGPFLVPTVTTTNGSNITYLSSGSYQMSSFSSHDSVDPMIVTGNAILYVTGSFTVSGSGYIEIMPGASLALYVGGTATISGGGVVNGTGLASNCTLIGLSGCANFIYSGSSAFIGTVSAPQAALTVSSPSGICGAIIANSIDFSGGGSIHYDESLGITGPSF